MSTSQDGDPVEKPGVSAEPPPANEQTPTPAVDEDDPDGVIARLTGGDQQKQEPEQPPAEKPEAEAPEKEAPAAAVEPEDEDKDLSEDEEKALSNRARKRIRKLNSAKKELEPLANYAAQLLNKARAKNITREQLEGWIETGLGYVTNDKAAIDQIVAMAKQAGAIPDAPAGRPDLGKVRVAINKLRNEDYELSEPAHAKLLAILEEAEKSAPPEPAKKPEPVHQAPAPVAPQPPAAQVDAQRVLGNIQRLEAEYAAEHPATWKDLRTKAYKLVGEWEEKMAPEIRGDVSRYESRLTRAIERVLADKSKPSALPITRSLQSSSTTPPPAKKLEAGTEEYEIAVLTGKITPDE